MSRVGNRIAAVVVLVFLALPLGLFGACSAILVAGEGVNGFDLGSLLLFLAFALVGFGGAYGTILLAKRLWGE